MVVNILKRDSSRAYGIIIFNTVGFFIGIYSMCDTDLVKLKTQILRFLKTLPDHCHFFICKNTSCQIVGIVKGQAICILIAENRRLTKKQITFSASTYHALGEFYVVHSLDDVLEIAKIGHWQD